MSSYVFRKTSNDATIYDLFSHLVPIMTSLHDHIGGHEVADPKPRRVFISQRLMRLVSLLGKLRSQLQEGCGLDHRSSLGELLYNCEEEICLLLDEMEERPELNVSELAMPGELLGMLWGLSAAVRCYAGCAEARREGKGLPTSEEAGAFGRARAAVLGAGEAGHSYRPRATPQELRISAFDRLLISPDPEAEFEALTSRHIQQLVTQIETLQLEVTELKSRQQAFQPPSPRILDPNLDRFLAAQRVWPVQSTPSMPSHTFSILPPPSMRSHTASIPPPPYALSDVGAKDCVGERWDNVHGRDSGGW